MLRKSCIPPFPSSYPDSLASASPLALLWDCDIPQDNLELCDALHFLPAKMRKQPSLQEAFGLSVQNEKMKTNLHMLQIASYFQKHEKCIVAKQMYLTCRLVVLKENNCPKNLEKHMITCTSSQGRCRPIWDNPCGGMVSSFIFSFLVIVCFSVFLSKHQPRRWDPALPPS